MFTATSPAHRVARELEADTALFEPACYDEAAPRVGMPAEAALFMHDGTLVTFTDVSCVEDLGFTAYLIRGGSVRNGTLTMRYKQPVLGDVFDDVVAEVRNAIAGVIPA